MATYHCQFKNGKVGTALKHMDYILRDGKYADKLLKEHLVYKEFGNMPEWAGEPREFWATSDANTRVNGYAYHEFEIALPNELPLEKQVQLIQEYVREVIGEHKGYTFAIHDKPAALNPNVRQPHAHLMFSEKQEDGIERSKDVYFKRYNPTAIERGGLKKDDRFGARNGKGAECIIDCRKKWEEIHNRAMEREGIAHYVTAKSIDAQRIEAVAVGDYQRAEILNRQPQIHMGPKIVQKFKNDMPQEERAREAYIINFADYKVRHNFIQSELAKAKEEIQALEAQQLETADLQNTRQAVIAGLRESFTIENQKDLLKKVEAEIRNQSAWTARAYNDITALRSSLSGEKGMTRQVHGVYTNWRSQKLINEHKAMMDAAQTYEELSAEFSTLPHPLAFTPKETSAAYFIQKEKLERMKVALEKRQDDYQREAAELKRELSSEVSKKNLDEMLDARHEHNDAVKMRMDNLQHHADVMREQKFALSEYQKLLTESAVLPKEAQQMKDTAQQTAERMEPVRENIKGAVQDVKAQPVLKQELLDILNTHIEDFRTQILERYRELNELKRRRITEEKALKVAHAIVTGGKSRKVAKVFADLKREKVEYRDAVAQLESMKATLDKERYQESYKRLVDWKKDLLARDEKNKRDVEQVKSILAAQGVSERVGNLQKTRMERNQIYDVKITRLEVQIHELDTARKELHGMKRYVYENTRKSYNLWGRIAGEASQIVGQLRQAIGDEGITRGGMRARIEKDSENER